MKHPVSVGGVPKYLGVSRSGYHAWLNRTPSDATQRRIRIIAKIRKLHQESHQIYGAPKTASELHKIGERITVKTVGNYMRQIGLKAHLVKPYTQTTIAPKFNNSLKNILDEQFNPKKPNAVWVSDITYLWRVGGFVYLTSIMDLFSRKIISWVLSQTLEAVHVVDAVQKAKKTRNADKPLVIPYNRGYNMFHRDF